MTAVVISVRPWNDAKSNGSSTSTSTTRPLPASRRPSRARRPVPGPCAVARAGPRAGSAGCSRTALSGHRPALGARPDLRPAREHQAGDHHDQRGLADDEHVTDLPHRGDGGNDALRVAAPQLEPNLLEERDQAERDDEPGDRLLEGELEQAALEHQTERAHG